MTLIEILENRQKALTVQEVAALLEVSRQHVYEMVADGTLPGFQVGRSVRIDPQDLADWLRKKRPVSVGEHGVIKRGKEKEPKLSRYAEDGRAVRRVLRDKVHHLEVAAAVESVQQGNR
jgi:excisionase family DNA binding protein